MTTTLRPSASGLAVGARRPSLPTPPPRVCPPLGRRGNTSLLNLKTSARRTTTAAPCVWRRRHGTHAHNSADDWPGGVPDPDDESVSEEEFRKFCEELKNCKLDKDLLFQEEIEKIDEYCKKITSSNTSIFHTEYRALSSLLCTIVKRGVQLASRIMESAVSRLDKKDEISSHTTKQTVAMYVTSFVDLAEAAYLNEFNHQSILSLLGALGGLAAISHILVDDALTSLNYVEDRSSKYDIFHDDIENSRCEFEQKIKNLEQNFMSLLENSISQTFEFLRPMMVDAMNATVFYVFKMISRRKMLLG